MKIYSRAFYNTFLGAYFLYTDLIQHSLRIQVSELYRLGLFLGLTTFFKQGEMLPVQKTKKCVDI